MPVARNPYSGWAALLYNRLATRGYDPVNLTSHGLPNEFGAHLPNDIDSTPPPANTTSPTTTAPSATPPPQPTPTAQPAVTPSFRATVSPRESAPMNDEEKKIAGGLFTGKYGLGYTPGMPVGSVNSRGAIFLGFSGGKPVFAPQSTAGKYGSNTGSGIVGGSGLGGYGAGGSNSGMFSGVSTSSGFGTGIGIGFGGAVQGGGPWPVKKY